MNLCITQPMVNALRKLSLNLSHYWYCKAASIGIQMDNSKEVKMLKLRYLLSEDGKLTDSGKQFLADIEQAVDSPVKKVKLESIIPQDIVESFGRFWNIWPSTKSVPGTNMLSGASMKSDRAKMQLQYAGIVQSGEITCEQMEHAAKVYIQMGIQDSIRRGRNEMEHRKGMQPWMHQKVYMNYVDIKLPEQQKAKQVITEVSI